MMGQKLMGNQIEKMEQKRLKNDLECLNGCRLVANCFQLAVRMVD